MFNCSRIFLITALLSVFLINKGVSQTAGEFRSIGSGSWFTSSIWEIYNGNLWVSDSLYPPSLHAHNIIIRNSDSITIPANDTLTLGNDIEVLGNLFVLGALYTDSFRIFGTGSFGIQGATSLLGLGDSLGLQSSAMSGNIQTDSRHIGSRVSLYYNGGHHQITGNGIPDTVSNLIIDLNDTFSAFSGLRLSRHMWLRDTLYFVHGRLVTDSATAILTIGPQGSSSGHTFNRFVNGPLRMSWASNSLTRKFVPLGKDTLYRPLDVSYNHNSSNLSIFHYELKNHGPHYTTIKNSANFNHISNKRYWLAERVHGTNTINQAYIGFSWGPSDHVNDYNSINVGKGNTARTEWDRIQANPTYTGSNTWGFAFVSDNQPADAVDYILASTSSLNLLPLTLVNFDTRCDFPFYYTTSWVTASEYDIEMYYLEYLGSEKSIIEKVSVLPQNLRHETSHYTHSIYLHAPLSSVKLWEHSYSGYQNLIIEQDAARCFGSNEPVQVFPNPSSIWDDFYIEIDPTRLHLNPVIRIWDGTGTLIMSKLHNDWSTGRVMIHTAPQIQKRGLYLIELFWGQDEVDRIKLIRY